MEDKQKLMNKILRNLITIQNNRLIELENRISELEDEFVNSQKTARILNWSVLITFTILSIWIATK